MISQQSPGEVEISVELIETQYITVVCTDRILISTLAMGDPEIDGDFRFFRPLFMRIDGVERVLPCELITGTHVIELLGERFKGTSLLIVGYGLQAIASVTIGAMDAALAAQVATVPGYYEDDGPPEGNPIVAGAINGARYKDRLNKIRYELSEGIWIQLAS